MKKEDPLLALLVGGGVCVLAGDIGSRATDSEWPYVFGWLAAIAVVCVPVGIAHLRVHGAGEHVKRWWFQTTVASGVFVTTWLLLPEPGVAAPSFAAGFSFLGAHAFRKWWATLGVEETTKLHGAEKIPLELSHPYLAVRATRTAAGRVTIVVEGIAKDLALERRRDRDDKTLEQRTGDAPFDAQIRVTGNSLTCRSLLDPLTRDAVVRAFDDFPGLTVNAGVLSWNGRPPDVHGSATRLLDLASHLVPPDLLAGLEKSALTDPAPSIRQRSLELLLTRFPSAPETHRIALAALGDAEPMIRLRAALFLGEEARPELAALASSESLPAEVRAEAVRNAGLLEREAAATIVRGALTDRRELVRNSAIITVGKLKLANCNDRLAVLVRRSPPALQLTIVEAAAATEDESAETPLLAALEGEAQDVKLAAVRALARVGSIRSVEPLLAMRGSQLLAGELGPAAGAAVIAIQARLAGAGAGQLALTENTGGEISFPGAEAGALSVPNAESGSLTLPEDAVDGRTRKAPQRQPG